MTVARWIVLVGALGSTISAAPATTNISILANNGALSFAPNPATAVSGDLLVWRNNDSFSVHRIVLDDGSLDTGDINPGASSAPIPLTVAGGGYHCAIHPSMVGTILAPVPTMPGTFMLLLAGGLIGLGWWRLGRRRARA
jgi:plastocyanin